jgi:transposase
LCHRLVAAEIATSNLSQPTTQGYSYSGTALIAPNRENRKKTQDGRKLRRYTKRWRVERLFAWMHWFRRLVTRYEYHIENFLGMVHLACLKLLLKHL